VISWRIDGVMQTVDQVESKLAANIVGRLKVLADLLTYRIDIPQEGRIKLPVQGFDMRVSTFPTIHGEKAVIRLFSNDVEYRYLEELGYPKPIYHALKQTLEQTSGVLLMTGPAGSGKTTSAYACMREISQQTQGAKSLVSIEDPVEIDLDGVDQSQVNLIAGFDLARSLKSLVRQDPDVILVGEIRDQETAESVFQASLIGHLVLTTFHAGSSCLAINRLLEMGIEPYLLKSGLLGVICQRLIRKRCSCVTSSTTNQPVTSCETCLGTGYRGRLLLCEHFDSRREDMRALISTGAEAQSMQMSAVELGLITLHTAGLEYVQKGLTTQEELWRVLGIPDA
jgi:type II secretory ATPase GspE/PulE/Tfp pilus assembly ATPase PilB-like protein